MGNKTQLWYICIQICIYDKLYINTMLCHIHLNDEELCNLVNLWWRVIYLYLIYDGEFSILFLLIYDKELSKLWLLIDGEELSNLYLLIYDEELSNMFLLIYEELSNLFLLIYFILGTTIKDDTKVDLAIIIGASVGGCVALLIIIIISCCLCLRTR